MCMCWQRFQISITPNQPNVYTHISRLLKSIFFIIIIIIVVSKIIILSLFYIVHTSTLLFYNGLKLLYNWWKLFSFSGRKTNKSTSIQSTWIKRGGGNYKRDKRYKIQDKQQKLIWNFFNWNRKIIFLIWLVNFFLLGRRHHQQQQQQQCRDVNLTISLSFNFDNWSVLIIII